MTEQWQEHLAEHLAAMEAAIELHRHGWWDEPRTFGDAVRCLLGRHRTAQSGTVNGKFVERCSCGAIRMGWPRWLRETWWCGPRKRPSDLRE